MVVPSFGRMSAGQIHAPSLLYLVDDKLPCNGEHEADTVGLARRGERPEKPVPNLRSDSRAGIANLHQLPIRHRRPPRCEWRPHQA